MSCPSPSLLERALHDLIDAGREEPGIVEHVEGCEACQSRLEALLSESGASVLCRSLAEASLDSETSACDQTLDVAGDAPQRSQEPARLPEVTGYEILERLGQGGMGVVYKARHLRLNRVVALKMILAGQHADADKLARFHSEAEAVARLRHPNIVTVHDVGFADGMPYIALEYLPGGSLEQVFHRGPTEARAAAGLLGLVAQGIHTAHLAGIVHRDLKPANVLLAEDGTPKITDFGLAKRLEAQGQTQTGQIIGTPAYMAPEQAKGESKNVGPAADVYALGALLYEMLTGGPPFRGQTMLETMAMVLADEPTPPRKHVPGVPRDLETVCLKALRKEPAERYRTAQEFADELNRFLHDEPVLARPLRRMEKAFRWCRRNPILAGLLAAATGLLLLVGLVGILVAYQIRLQEARNGEETQRERAEEALQKANRYLYFNSIYLADRAYHDNQMARARQLLMDYGISERTEAGWEWRYLDRITRAERSIAAGHTEAVHALAFDPQGKWLVSGGTDRALLFWKPGGERPVQRWAGHGAPVWGLALASDGTRLASVSGSMRRPGELIVWDMTGGPGQAGRILYRLPGCGERAAVSFHPDRPVLAVATGLVVGRPGGVRVIDENGREAARWEGDADQGCVATAWSRDGSRLAMSFVRAGSAGELGHVVIRDTRTGGVLHHLSPPNSGGILALAYSPDGKTLATGGADRVIRLWDTVKYTLVQTCRGHASAVNALSFAPDGRLLSGSKDTTVRVWDPRLGEELFARRGHLGEVFAVGTDPGTGQIVSAGDDTRIRAWRSEQSQEAEVFALHRGAVNSLAFRPDGKALISVGEDGAVWRIDPECRELPRLLRKENRPLRQVRFLPGGSAMLVAGGGPERGRDDGAIRLLDPNDGSVQGELTTSLAACSWMSLSGDGTRLAVVGHDREENPVVQVWSLPGRRRLHEIQSPGAAVAYMFRGGSRLLVLGNRSDLHSPGLAEYDLSDVVRLRSVPPLLDRGHRFVLFNADESFVVIGLTSGVFGIHAADRNYANHHPLKGHAGFINNAVLSPDEKLLATASEDETVRLWDFEQQMELLVLRGDQSAMRDVAFSPDGQLLAAAQASGAVRLWSARPYPQNGDANDGSQGTGSKTNPIRRGRLSPP